MNPPTVKLVVLIVALEPLTLGLEPHRPCRQSLSNSRRLPPRCTLTALLQHSYAPVSWSDVPKQDGRRLWIGWMNNWETHLVATRPWRSTPSIPRVLRLRDTEDGLRLVQHPIQELQSLRRDAVSFNDLVLAEGTSWSDSSLAGQQLEIEIELQVGAAKEVGLRVFVGEREATIIGYDVARQELFVDRTNSGDVAFHPAFPGKHSGQLPLEDGTVKLHLFLDTSSVEVFGGDG